MTHAIACAFLCNWWKQSLQNHSWSDRMPDRLAHGGSIKFLKVQITFFNSFIIANDNVTVYRFSCSGCRVVFINNLKLKPNILLNSDAWKRLDRIICGKYGNISHTAQNYRRKSIFRFSLPEYIRNDWQIPGICSSVSPKTRAPKPFRQLDILSNPWYDTAKLTYPLYQSYYRIIT